MVNIGMEGLRWIQKRIFHQFLAFGVLLLFQTDKNVGEVFCCYFRI